MGCNMSKKLYKLKFNYLFDLLNKTIKNNLLKKNHKTNFSFLPTSFSFLEHQVPPPHHPICLYLLPCDVISFTFKICWKKTLKMKTEKTLISLYPLHFHHVQLPFLSCSLNSPFLLLLLPLFFNFYFLLPQSKSTSQ
jgi:hypothetical protein